MWQLQRGGPLRGYFQPVEIKVPPGAEISLAGGDPHPAEGAESLLAGMLIGQVYRARVTRIPLHLGEEVFPSVELIDRLYPPPHLAARFPIPIEITQDDLEAALDGKYVVRVVYLEDPRFALPVRQEPGRPSWFDVEPGEDPLQTADALGRPVAIVRMGGRVPLEPGEFDGSGEFCSPPVMRYSRAAAEGISDSASAGDLPSPNKLRFADRTDRGPTKSDGHE